MIQCEDCDSFLPQASFPLIKRTGRDPRRSKKCQSCRWHNRKANQGPRFQFFKNARLRYGLQPEDIDEMILSSEGRCDSCSEPFRNNRKEPMIDHCHKTGKVRGLLCTRCNLIAGTLEKETRRVKLALAYLKARR